MLIWNGSVSGCSWWNKSKSTLNIAETKAKRAQEDHQHVTEMHNLVLQTLKNQEQEIEGMKQLMAALSGRPYEPYAPQPIPDLRELHPRGDERFQEDDLEKRWQEQMHHNPLVSTLREDLMPHTDE